MTVMLLCLVVIGGHLKLHLYLFSPPFQGEIDSVMGLVQSHDPIAVVAADALLSQQKAEESRLLLFTKRAQFTIFIQSCFS